jgi:hypothetical protein
MNFCADGVCSEDLGRLATLAKLMVMFDCLEASRSYSGMDPLGRLGITPASKFCPRLAISDNRGSSLESISLSESRCSGDTA